MRNGDTHNYNVPTIAPNKMVVFSVFDSPTYTGTGVNDSRVGGLVVVGSQTMAGVVMEHDHNVAPAVVLNGTRGLTSADFATTAYAPIIKSNRFGRFTGLQVQNVSAGPIDVTVSYEGTAGACAGSDYTETADDLAPNASVTFVHFPGRTSLPENCTASATVTATGNFVSIVNEQEMTGMPKAGITYFGLTNATNTISVPQYKDVRFNATSGLQIQNVGNAAATSWTATFVCQGGASFTAISDPAKTGAIPAGGAFNFFTPSDNDLFTAANPFASNNVNCAVTIEADQPIVAVNNEMAYPAVGVLDDNNFEGFNLP
jgi:hypothetical protein